MISLIPISDANPTRRFPIFTIVLIAMNAFAFFALEPDFGTSAESAVYFIEKAPIPCQLEDSCPTGIRLTPQEAVRIPDRDVLSWLGAAIFSTFLHAGFLHIAGNMLFLWVFGNNIEDFLGPGKFIGFYLAGGLAASLAHALTHLDSAVPAVGASGAVAAVMGAYLVLYPRARVNVLVPIVFIWTILQMSAVAVLGIWFVYQFLIGYQEYAGSTSVAWMAHVGGFAFGVVTIFLLGGRPHPPPRALERRVYGW